MADTVAVQAGIAALQGVHELVKVRNAAQAALDGGAEVVSVEVAHNGAAVFLTAALPADATAATLTAWRDALNAALKQASSAAGDVVDAASVAVKAASASADVVALKV